jgi:glycosyltransferase involved in cell wall biosynthesis
MSPPSNSEDLERRRLKHARAVRAVIGVPLYNAVERGYFQDALDTLLGQAYPYVAFVFVDDCSTDATYDVVARLADHDIRVYSTRNTERTGLARNWRRTFGRARELFPDAPYFAWGSDHDRWNRRWLDMLVRALDTHPSAVMAYPRFTRIDGSGTQFKGRWPDSLRKSTPLLLNWLKIGAGKLVYGLYRSEMLERAGVLPLVHEPDVYLMLELSLYGELRMVPKTLWHRRERPSSRRAGAAVARPIPGWPQRVTRAIGISRVRRQHRFLFPDGVPLYARLPTWLQHVSLLFWRLAVAGRGRPYVGRWAGAAYAGRLLVARLTHSTERQQGQQRPSRDDERKQEGTDAARA